MEAGGLAVAVAAPTGRAAKRIAETTGKPAVTVHRLLDYYYDEEARQMVFGRYEGNPLDYDAVIIDETSMMDLKLTAALFRALPKDCRLIFAGDKDQLPSVGAGNVLGDCIDSGYIFTSELTEIFRQSEESNIITNAHRINKGQYPEVGGDFLLVEGDKQQEIVDKITKIATEYDLNKVQVLTPTKKGILGSYNLNTYLQQVFNPKAEDKDELKFGSVFFRKGDRVMQTKNNYRLEFKRKDGTTGKGVFNGETGTVAEVHPEEKKITVCYDDDRWVEYPYIQLDEIELAYAITVHKSQGNQFPVVVMPLAGGSNMLFSRSLLYTGITRAEKLVILIGREDVLSFMVENDYRSVRYTGLKNMFRLVDDDAMATTEAETEDGRNDIAAEAVSLIDWDDVFDF